MDKNEGTAKSRYNKLSDRRSPYLESAYRAAQLTIPGLFPDSSDSTAGPDERNELEATWQSIGARGVNNLSAKFLLTLFPPGHPLYRYSIDPTVMRGVEDETERAEQMNRIEALLANREEDVRRMYEEEGNRPKTNEAARQLIVAGNVALHLPQDRGMRVFRLNRYVCRRDGFGRVVEAVIKENLAFAGLDEASQAHVRALRQHRQDIKPDEDVELYTHIKIKTQDSYSVYQEIEGEKVKGTDGTFPADAPTYIFLRLASVDGEDYARGFVEEYIGDLRAYDGLSQSIIEAAAISAEVKHLVDPNGETDADDLENAENGAYVAGREKDVTTHSVDKSGDFTVAATTRSDLKGDLGFVYLLNSAVRRPGERVTAEEIREVARELEDAFGGLYSVLAQEWQLPVVKRYELRAEKDDRLTPLPKIDGKPVAKPVIVTGIDALGRSHDQDRIVAFTTFCSSLATIPDHVMRYLPIGELLLKAQTNLGLAMTGTLKTDQQVQEEMQAEQQAAQQAELARQAVTPGINAIAKAQGGQTPGAPTQ